jgi:hypothetical protein
VFGAVTRLTKILSSPYGFDRCDRRGVFAALLPGDGICGSSLAFRLLADGSDLKSSKDWVGFAKTSPVFTASALAALEGARRVRHCSRR